MDNQVRLSEKLSVNNCRLCDYKAGRRVPDDALIGQLAEYLGLDPIATILQCKAETDKEKATLWQRWLEQSNWRAWRELNPRPSASEADTLSN